jgi:hypothetical protein
MLQDKGKLIYLSLNIQKFSNPPTLEFFQKPFDNDFAGYTIRPSIKTEHARSQSHKTKQRGRGDHDGLPRPRFCGIIATLP